MTMALSAPGMLWTFLAVPLALLLAVLMRRETRVAVGSLHPWRAVLALPRPRPHRNPLDVEVLCIVLAAALVVFALLKPILQVPLRGERRVYLVLDDSMRMQAHDPDGTTRWMQARAAWQHLRTAYPNAETTLFLTSENRPRVVRGRLADLAIPAAPSTHPPDASRYRDLLTAILEAAAQEDAAVVWISDTDPGVEDARLEVVRVGSSVPNQALLEADWVRGNPPSVFFALGNFSDMPYDGTLLLTQDDAVLLRVPLTLTPHDSRGRTESLPADLLRDTPLTLHLTPDDDALPDDNIVTLPPLSTRHVRVPASLPPRLGLALEAAGLLPVTTEESASLAVVGDGADTGSAEVLLLVDPGRATHGLLAYGAPKRIHAARVRGGAEGLPAMTAEGLVGADVPPVQLPPGSRVLLEAMTADGNAEAWMASWTWEGRRVLYIAGLPETWTERSAFPVALSSLLAPHMPAASPLPGATGSDTTQTHAAPPHVPQLQAGEPPLWEMPLTRIATALALAALFLPLTSEWKRTRSRRTAT